MPAATERGAIRLEGVRKSFGDQVAVDRIDLDIKPGEFLTLLGESGCGKTTTLMLIAGFLVPTEGSISLDGRAVNKVPPYRRDLGVVFQNYALFPHMTVADNVAYPLRRRGTKRKEIPGKVKEALRLVSLEGYENRYPRELSGGQQQRVAVARATVYGPPALLMDEPLSALDRKLRQGLQEEIRVMHRQLGTTVVYVTHDQDEALALSDRIALMRRGRIEQIGTPEDVYQRPTSRFAVDFLGDANMMRGEIVGREGDLVEVKLDLGKVVRAGHANGFDQGDRVTVVVRPENLNMDFANEAGEDPRAVPVEVDDVIYLGASARCVGRFAGGEKFIMPIGSSDLAVAPDPGSRRHVSWAAEEATIVGIEE